MNPSIDVRLQSIASVLRAVANFEPEDRAYLIALLGKTSNGTALAPLPVSVSPSKRRGRPPKDAPALTDDERRAAASAYQREFRRRKKLERENGALIVEAMEAATPAEKAADELLKQFPKTGAGYYKIKNAHPRGPAARRLYVPRIGNLKLSARGARDGTHWMITNGKKKETFAEWADAYATFRALVVRYFEKELAKVSSDVNAPSSGGGSVLQEMT